MAAPRWQALGLLWLVGLAGFFGGACARERQLANSAASKPAELRQVIELPDYVYACDRASVDAQGVVSARCPSSRGGDVLALAYADGRTRIVEFRPSATATPVRPAGPLRTPTP